VIHRKQGKSNFMLDVFLIDNYTYIKGTTGPYNQPMSTMHTNCRKLQCQELGGENLTELMVTVISFPKVKLSSVSWVHVDVRSHAFLRS
jgi:hypothetical protein